MTGKPGSGKSALINGLLGEQVMKESIDVESTSEMQEFTQIINGTTLSVLEYHGDPYNTDNNMKEQLFKCQSPDLVLYTIQMTDNRVHAEDTRRMKGLTNAFGTNVWGKVIIVMTFANRVWNPDYPHDVNETEKYYNQKLSDWKKILPQLMVKGVKLPRELSESVPIVPAGFYKIQDLPGEKHWLRSLWMETINHMNHSSADKARYISQFNRDSSFQDKDLD